MLLRPLRRLHHLLLPLQAAAMVAFALRLGWGHDPRCPHHAGTATKTHEQPAALPEAGPPAEHVAPDSHARHASHAARATQPPHEIATAPHSTHASPSHASPSHAPPDGSNEECHCLDKGFCLGGVAATVPQFTQLALPTAPLRWIGDVTPAPELPTPCDAYRSHRLPFPHAPPCVVDIS